MQAHIKNAVITTAVVLATVWALRQLSVTRSVVNTALGTA